MHLLLVNSTIIRENLNRYCYYRWSWMIRKIVSLPCCKLIIILRSHTYLVVISVDSKEQHIVHSDRLSLWLNNTINIIIKLSIALRFRCKYDFSRIIKIYCTNGIVNAYPYNCISTQPPPPKATKPNLINKKSRARMQNKLKSAITYEMMCAYKNTFQIRIGYVNVFLFQANTHQERPPLPSSTQLKLRHRVFGCGRTTTTTRLNGAEYFLVPAEWVGVELANCVCDLIQSSD